MADRGSRSRFRAAAAPPAAPPAAADDTEAALDPMEPAQNDAGRVEADESGDEAMINSDDDEASSEASQVEAEVAAAAQRGRGGGRGRGRGEGRGRGRRGGKGGGTAAAAAAGAAGAKQPKYKWVDANTHTFASCTPYAGSKLPTLSSKLDGLDLDSPTSGWFEIFDAPDQEYTDRAVNSQKYRLNRELQSHDGTNPDGSGKRCYDGATPITYADMRTLDASILLNGLDPAVSREKVYAHDRLAVVGHRSAELFARDREQMLRKFHHPGDITKAIPKGQPGHDNLHQVAAMLRSTLKASREAIGDNGEVGSTDEETIGFQGPHAQLKQSCGKFKAAGDGLQCDAVCIRGGFLKAFAFRGHTLLPRVSVKDRADIKLCDVHQRTLWVWYQAGLKAGNLQCMDNLYNSADFSHLAEEGATIIFQIPPGYSTELEYTGNFSQAVTIEWPIESVHVIGTLRGNRGSEKKYEWAEKMGKAAVDALRAKPLLPDRCRIRVTDDDAQVVTVAIFDKKGFQMIDTYHEKIELQAKPRRVFDRATGRPTTIDVPIRNTQNAYNLGMGYVDLDDLLAWFYRSNHFREHKFWAPVYVYAVRKRVDQAYKARQIRYFELLSEAEAEKDAAVGEVARKAAEEKIKLVKSKKIEHFDFIEGCAAYHLIKVESGESSSAAASAGADSKRVRGRKYSVRPDGETPWPVSRLTPDGHAIGRHATGVRVRCDYPGCQTIATNQGDESLHEFLASGKKKAAKTTGASTPAGTPALPPGLTTRPTLPTGKATGKRPARGPADMV